MATASCDIRGPSSKLQAGALQGQALRAAANSWVGRAINRGQANA